MNSSCTGQTPAAADGEVLSWLTDSLTGCKPWELGGPELVVALVTDLACHVDTGKMPVPPRRRVGHPGEPDGGHIKSRPVTPTDLTATLYRHMQVPLDTQYLDPRGRPRYVVDGGQPIAELF